MIAPELLHQRHEHWRRRGASVALLSSLVFGGYACASGAAPKATVPQIWVSNEEGKNRLETAQPRLLEAAAAWGDVTFIPLNSIRRSDLFDVAQNARVTKSSGVASPGENTFGLVGGAPDLGMSTDGTASHWNVTFFDDGKPVGHIHSIEWHTNAAVKVESVGLFARHDEIIEGYEFRRAFSRFRLYTRANADWIQVAEYSPMLPYGGGDTHTKLAVCIPVKPTTATEFRAEFVQAVDILGQFSGPRLVGLDGNSKKCKDQYPE